MIYLLDTDTCIFAIKGNSLVLKRLLSVSRWDVAISVITEAELRSGASKSNSPQATLQRLEAFLSPIAILPFNSEDAMVYGDVRARLEQRGQPIGPLDTLIAAQALSRGLTLVTNNEREFRRVQELAIENWKADPSE
ncbi:type II toxin-antitoxin system tRNA(fMet)-specific endonuclease VapC [Cyanobium sp. ATX 6F1]|uniref:type II toxin-antitoxin system tRNA(fMet)-specific endonuclease VapC n=1 Tax=unclassified Cyanobium TaxID=2627006 RepID=UPI0020CDFAFF|nr:type II toxin-antitoxin system VapC family toxin [Cyanobium sp. ATX 6F1]MCP9915805.1 type II toxin-antitoxin system VapC family toxin [Cyanobium sp. ATX 6F1]